MIPNYVTKLDRINLREFLFSNKITSVLFWNQGRTTFSRSFNRILWRAQDGTIRCICNDNLLQL